jgi:hypothetical protein
MMMMMMMMMMMNIEKKNEHFEHRHYVPPGLTLKSCSSADRVP